MRNEANDMTERLLCDAGLDDGMRVLDFGCGRGDVAFMATRRVGARGMVLGIDHDECALTEARERARALRIRTATFANERPAAIAADRAPFDAIVGRRVLMYLPDPVATLAELATALRPGGLVCFQEHDATLTSSAPVALPAFTRVRNWIWDTVIAEGANPHMGFDLHRTLERAGLVVEGIRAEAVVQTPRTPQPLAGIVRAMLPRIVARRIATADEIDVDTLDQRLLAERVAGDVTSIGELVFGVWARKPG